MIENVAGDSRRGLDAVLCQFLSMLDLLDLESVDGLSLDVWHEIHDDLSDAFADRPASPQLAALVDTARRFHVPRQFLYDPLRGADLWIRSRHFQDFRELEAFCSYVGGATVASLAPVIGLVRADYEVPAIACGKAIMLTHLLANCVEDVKHHRIFLAREDLRDCQVDLSRLRLRQPNAGFSHLVRLYVSRIEPLFGQAGGLLSRLDFDGQRSLKTLLAFYWNGLVTMQREPDSVLRENGVWPRSLRRRMRTRHLLGLEPKLNFLSRESRSHH